MVSTVADEYPGEHSGDSLMRRGVVLIVELVRGSRIPFALSLFGAVVFAATAVAGAIVLGRVTDDLIVDRQSPPTTSAALGAAAVIVGIAVVRGISVILRRYFGSKAMRQSQKRWFDELSDHYLAQPLSFYTAEPTGKLLAHADTDAERASFAVMPLPLTLGAILMLVFAAVNLAVLDPVLLVIGLLLFPTLIVINHLYSTRVEAPAALAQAGVGKVSAIAHESFEGALVVKLLGLEERESRRLAAAADELRSDRVQLGRLRATFEPALEALPSLGTVALLAVGAARVDAGAVTTGDLVQAMTLFGILSFPMRVMGFFLEELPRSVVSRDRIVGVLGTDLGPSDDVLQVDETVAVDLPTGPLSIEVDDVAFSYDGPMVVSQVDFVVAPGEVVALVGTTGCGKSTVCRLAGGLVRPASGEVRIGGVSLASANPRAVRDAVALVFQETFLFADSVRENLSAGQEVASDEILRALDIAQADFVERLPDGLDTEIGERGATLSGGQRQRLALARAVLRRPRVLILDDATSAIDPLVEQRILDRLRNEMDTTTLVVAHRVATIRLADRVLYMRSGRIVAEGSHEDLLANDAGYAALVRAYEDDSIEDPA